MKQNEFTVYQVSLKGYIETENPDELFELINKAIDSNKGELFGQFTAYQLAPYVDYQKADVTDSRN